MPTEKTTALESGDGALVVAAEIHVVMVWNIAVNVGMESATERQEEASGRTSGKRTRASGVFLFAVERQPEHEAVEVCHGQ